MDFVRGDFHNLGLLEDDELHRALPPDHIERLE
jgi:hypothetical protein